MFADLLVLQQLQYFDVVLGMDWLAWYCAMIDCEERTVIFREPGQEEFVYRGCQSALFVVTISSARARQMMSHGCVAFQAAVVKVPTAAPGLKGISIVREFLYVFPPDLMMMPPDREVEFVIDIAPGTTITEVRSFFRLAGYSRWFVEGFAKLSTPLTRLTRKRIKFIWSEACQRSFEKLKLRLMSTPILALPVIREGFVIYNDASLSGLGCVLM